VYGKNFDLHTISLSIFEDGRSRHLYLLHFNFLLYYKTVSLEPSQTDDDLMMILGIAVAGAVLLIVAIAVVIVVKKRR